MDNNKTYLLAFSALGYVLMFKKTLKKMVPKKENLQKREEQRGKNRLSVGLETIIKQYVLPHLDSE
jgi:hypothetical protein